MIKIRLNMTSMMYNYWIVIILWQTFRPVANRSLVDVLVKIVCFAALCIYGYNRKNFKNTKSVAICSILFLVTQVVTYATDSINSSTVITGVFMFAQILVFLIFLRSATISGEEIAEFGNWTIIWAMIMCVYNVVFNASRFVKLFSASAGAYGSECKSFLYSNHEFSIYITAAIIFLVWKLINKSYNKYAAFAMLGFFALNLLSTYSRTSILGCIAAVVVLFFYYNKKYFGILCGVIAACAIAIFSIPWLKGFVLNKIFKGSFEASGGIIDEGRANMYLHEIEFFKSGNGFQKIFGHGYVSGTASGGHNAYLYILNIGGIVMFAFFALIIVWSIVNSFRCIKHNRVVGSVCLGLQVYSLVYMAAQTPILFFSTMDSYFITMIAVLVPMYCLNGVQKEMSLQEQAQ